MKLKLNKDGSAVVRNGAPVYVMDNGTEREIDGAAAFKLALGKHFEASPVMSRLKLPADIIAASFGSHFDIQGGKLVALDKHGIKEYSSSRPGEVATFDEALGQLIDRYPNKSMLLKEPDAPGAAQAPGQQQGSGSTITRDAFDALSPAARAKYITGGGRVGEVASAAPTAPPSGSVSDAALSVEQKTLDLLAVGTNYVPRDMPALIHEGERVIPKADNVELMNRLRSPATDNNAELLAELRELRREVAETRGMQESHLYAIAKNTLNTSDTLEAAAVGDVPLATKEIA